MKSKSMSRIEAAQTFLANPHAQRMVKQAIDHALYSLEQNKQSFSAHGELITMPWRADALRATTDPTLLLHRHNTLQGRVHEHGLFFAYRWLLDRGLFRELEQQSFFGTRKGAPVTAWDAIVRYMTDPTTQIVIGELMATRADARDRIGSQVAAETASITLRKFKNLHRQSANTSAAKIRDNRLMTGYVPLGLVHVRQSGPHDEFAIRPGLVSILFHERVFIPTVTKWAPTLAGTAPDSAA